MNARLVVSFAAVLGLGVVSLLAPGCQTAPEADPKGSNVEKAAATRPAADLPMPKLSATKPADYPGLHNVVAFADDVLSGSVPEGKEGFESLRRMGIKTILSVDGAAPEVDVAKAEGMRYVHLPITYSGFGEERKLEIARVLRDLPRPIYVHCHHGKHRSAGAAGAALVTLGELTPETGVARMKVSGTSPDYKGLYACTTGASKVMPAVLDAVKPNFQEVSRPAGTVKAMVEIDFANDNLKEIRKADWKTPKEHPDLVPAVEAGRLADHTRFLKDDDLTKKKGAEYLAWLLDSSAKAESLEAGLTTEKAASKEELEKRWTALQATCKQCHVKYRD